MELTQQQGSTGHGLLTPKQRNMGEVAEYFDAHWKVQPDPSLQRMKALDKLFESPSKSVPAILVGGTNGKTITSYFVAKLLAHEGLRVGTLTAPHLLMYKERCAIDTKTIPSKIFTELGNEIISAVEEARIEAHTSELLLILSLLYFKRNNVDVAVFEIVSAHGAGDPTAILDAKVATITRVTSAQAVADEARILKEAEELVTFVKPGMHLVSGDQSKATLHVLQRITQERGGVWAMPLRKLAHLPYPFEQLHGRCAALAERVARLFMEQCAGKSDAPAHSILVRIAAQRGRPTLEKKREQELNPRKTIEQFWKETLCEAPGKFQILDKEKPSILLDTANNLDAFKNVLLGVRLLHYQRPLKGLAIIIGAAQETLHSEEFLKALRYFFKKTTGQVYICPVGAPIPGVQTLPSWDIEQVTADIKVMKVKVRLCGHFEEAFELAKKSVDERHGLVVITGSASIVAEYWKHKGVKKF